MRLYLIRHGETVDNVAGLYAGVRDSALTNHGVEQAQRLGQYFEKHSVAFTHILCSPLSRAHKTAQAIQAAQSALEGSASPQAKIVTVDDLIEQDFGYYEGKSFHARSSGSKQTRKEAHREIHKNDTGFVDVESKDSMNNRADTFLKNHLMPLFAVQQAGSERHIVAIVSHGILLSHLWRRLLLRFPPRSVSVTPEVVATKGTVILEHLGGWSNTGYLELSLTCSPTVADVQQTPCALPTPKPAPDVAQNVTATRTDTELVSNTKLHTPQKVSGALDVLTDWTVLVLAVDRKDHLIGLKRQRGGIGRSAHDEGQKKLDGYFKRQRTS